MEDSKVDAKIELGKGGLKSAVHGIFAKIQSKTGIEDKKIDEFQEKWLAIPENRTKYKHLVDAPTIVAEELFAMFNDIIDFMQSQEAAKSHVFESLRAEAKAIKKSPEIYLGEKMDYGKSLWQKMVGHAKCLIGKKAPVKMPDGPEEDRPEEELSDFEKAELEDEKEEEMPPKSVRTKNLASRPATPKKPASKPSKKAKPATAKPKTTSTKEKRN